jgi:PAS domain S-box-containing protein
VGGDKRDRGLDARLRVLSAALRAFSEATTDYERLLDVVARTVADVVADGCIVRLLTPGGWLAPVAFHLPLESTVKDADSAARLRRFMAAPRNVGEYAWGPHLIETGEPFLLQRLEMAEFRTQVTADVADVYDAIGIHSMLVVALRLRGETIGTLSLFRFHPGSPSFDESDREMAQALADHAALAIANARSYRAERLARGEAERATARFQCLSEAGIIGTIVVNMDGRKIVDVNDTLLRLIGYTRDELLSGVVWSSLTPPEWANVDARAIEQLRTSGVAGLREKELVRKDGRRVPVLAGSAMLGPGSTECISFFLDLAERKDAERALHEAERRSQRIVESATVGMWMIDAQGRTTFVNRRMAEILGATVAEAMSTPLSEFIVPEERAVIDERLAQRQAGMAGSYEQRFRRRDGAIRLLWIEASPLRDAQGAYDGVTGIVSDITDRRETEDALRASEARYRLMFDKSPLSKWLYDVETLRFLDVNDAIVRELGYPRDELLSLTLKDIRPPEVFSSDVEQARPGDLIHGSGMGRLVKKNGEIIQVEITRHSLTIGGRPCSLAVARDVTDRLRLEEQLRQAQKMEAVGRLAGGVAHDFNNVLSVILSYCDLLLDDIKPDEPMRGDIEEMRRAGERASGLTRQLLMFSRRQVIAPKVLDLNEVLTNMDKLLQRIVGADVDLVSLPARALGRIRADPSSLEQVIMNLVVNARDAMPRGGKITMETANVVLDEAYAEAHLGVKPGPHVMLAVTDTGTGIDKATFPRIFEPFFTTKEPGKGTGLGLATVFGVVQQSGGSVWVYSEPGEGTTFKVYLPRVDDAVDVAREPDARIARSGSETILLVEDDDQVRVVARGILRRGGYNVIDAHNPGEALLSAEEYRGTIHLLLSDVVMPQMSGPALAKRLGAARPEMKVLCMSGYTDDSIVRHGVLDARIAFVQKPITPDALMAKVREVLDA